MKIAILFFGQPRYLDKTYKYILEEFNIPGCTIDYFGHFWEKIGFVPEDEKKEQLQVISKKEINNLLPFKGLTLENNSQLNRVCESMCTINNILFNNTLPWPGDIEDFRYYIGQHYSIKQCYNLIAEYEQENNFKYDIIVKARTDVIYKNEPCYRNRDEYIKNKIVNYKWFRSRTEPAVKCSAMRILDSNGEDVHNIKEYYDGSYITHESSRFGPSTKIDIKLSYTKRLAITDWTLIANRSAAEIFYNTWFEAMLSTWHYDYMYKKTFPGAKWFIRSQQCIQGHIICTNKIFADHLVRRDTKLYDDTNLKPGSSIDKNICVNLPLQHQLKIRFPIK